MPERKIELLDSRFKVHSVSGYNPMIIEAEYIGPVACPRCAGTHLRTKDRIQRRLHHASVGRCATWLHLVFRKYHCLDCGRYFRPRMPADTIMRKAMRTRANLNREEAARMGREGRQRVEEHFTREAMVASTAKLLWELARERGLP